MLKKLLMSATVAMMAISASAGTKVLWEAEDPETGVAIADWERFYTLTPETAADLKLGDKLELTVTAAATEGWPQVAVFDATVGWPPLTNAGVGGKEYPYVAEFFVSNDILNVAKANGLTFSGAGEVSVSKLELVETDIIFDPNTVFFGPKQCDWGNAISISKDVFANVGPGDKLQVEYDKTAGHTLQFIFGGWGGLNIATYEAGKTDFITNNEEKGVYTIDLKASVSEVTWGEGENEKTYDIFELLKTNGIVMQGPCLVNAVVYTPFSAKVQYDAVLEQIEAVEKLYNDNLAFITDNKNTGDITEMKEIIENAISEAKNGAKVAYEIAQEEGSEYTYTFSDEEIRNMITQMLITSFGTDNVKFEGPKECNWGIGIGLDSEVFAEVAPGAKIVVVFDTQAKDQTLQFIFGGWSGAPNLPTYQAGSISFMDINKTIGTMTLDLTENLDHFTWEEKEYDLFDILKTSGIVMQGPCTVNAVIYVPAPKTSGIEAIEAGVEAAPVYYNLQGIRMANDNLPAGIYVKVTGNKAEKVAIK